MEQNPDVGRPKKTLYLRAVWFLVGAVANNLLISLPFKYLKQRFHLGDLATSALSMGTAAIPFFLFNYFVGFRTEARKRDALQRYLIAVVVLWAMGTGILTLFKSYDAHLSFSLFGFSIDLDVVATQACSGWLKFIIYHKWVFPVPKPPGADT